MNATAGAAAGMGMLGLTLAGSGVVVADGFRRQKLELAHAAVAPLLAIGPAMVVGIDHAYDAPASKTGQTLMIAGYAGAVGYLALTVPTWLIVQEVANRGKESTPKRKTVPNWISIPALVLGSVGIAGAAYELGTLPSRARWKSETTAPSSTEFKGSPIGLGQAVSASRRFGIEVTPMPGGVAASGWF